MRAIDTFESLIQKVHEMSANYYDETIEVHQLRDFWQTNSESPIPISADVQASFKRKTSIIGFAEKQRKEIHSFVVLMEPN